MHIFPWAPTPVELAATVDWLLAGVAPQVRRAIACHFSGQGLAFFKELKSEVLKELIIERVRGNPSATQGLDARDIEAELEATPFHRFKSIGAQIIAARATLNYLER
jgi:hypothetical protein